MEYILEAYGYNQHEINYYISENTNQIGDLLSELGVSSNNSCNALYAHIND